jgi:hypothetical protein
MTRAGSKYWRGILKQMVSFIIQSKPQVFIADHHVVLARHVLKMLSFTYHNVGSSLVPSLCRNDVGYLLNQRQ